MRKISFLIIVFQLTFFGYEYDELILKAQTSIFPKLILLDKDIAQKTSKNSIILAVVYHPSDYKRSKLIKRMIEEKFQSLLDNYRFKIILKKFDEVNINDKVTAYYILQGECDSIKKVSSIAQKRSISTFSYDIENFEDGILISLAIYNKSYIYMNKNLVKKYNINFVDTFYQIVRFPDE